MTDAKYNQHLLGELIYLIITHPIIIYDASIHRQFMQEPHMLHSEGASQFLVFIKLVPRKGPIYRCHDHLPIEAYFDVRYARDKGNRKSPTKSCTCVGGTLIAWCSRKEKVLCCSSEKS